MDRQDMIAEATDFGLQFPGNISNKKLASLLAEHKGDPIPVEESAPPSPAAKVEAEPVIADDIVTQRFKIKRMRIAKAKKAAMKTSVVTITNKDNRENDVMTTAFLSFENQHFGVSKNVPLDIPVELEHALIHIARSCTMTLHKDEIVGGRRTGNKVPVVVKKYAVSYEQAPKE